MRTRWTDEDMLDFESNPFQKIKHNRQDTDGYYVIKKKATSKRRQNRKIFFEEEDIDFENDNY